MSQTTYPDPRSALQALVANFRAKAMVAGQFSVEGQIDHPDQQRADQEAMTLGQCADALEAVLASWPPAPPALTQQECPACGKQTAIIFTCDSCGDDYLPRHLRASALTLARPSTAEPEKEV